MIKYKTKMKIKKTLESIIRILIHKKEQSKNKQGKIHRSYPKEYYNDDFNPEKSNIMYEKKLP